MKSFNTVFIIILHISCLSAQDFAPVDAKWHVELAEPFAPEWSGTLTNTSLRDTFLNGITCKVLLKSQGTIFNEIQGEYILCQQNDSILHYIPELDSFNVVMNFGAQIGESWESFDRANEYVSFNSQRNQKYVVDSISYIFSSNNDSIRVQHLTAYGKAWNEPESEYKWNGTRELIQYVGFKNALLPANDGDGWTDDIFETQVRCYEDPIIGIIKLTDDSNCFTSSTDQVEYNEFKIYPNPNNGIINIEGDISSIDRIEIISSFGKIILSEKPTNQLYIQNIPNGIYLVHLYSKSKSSIKKIVIEN